MGYNDRRGGERCVQIHHGRSGEALRGHRAHGAILRRPGHPGAQRSFRRRAAAVFPEGRGTAADYLLSAGRGHFHRQHRPIVCRSGTGPGHRRADRRAGTGAGKGNARLSGKAGPAGVSPAGPSAGGKLLRGIHRRHSDHHGKSSENTPAAPDDAAHRAALQSGRMRPDRVGGAYRALVAPGAVPNVHGSLRRLDLPVLFPENRLHLSPMPSHFPAHPEGSLLGPAHPALRKFTCTRCGYKGFCVEIYQDKKQEEESCFESNT